MTLQALIFDVDGTLAETEGMHLQAFNLAFKKAGLDWHWSGALYKQLLKTAGGKERIKTYLNEHLKKDVESWEQNIPQLHAQKTKYYIDIVNSCGLKLRPGIQSLIDEAVAAGLILAVATTTSRPNLEALCRSIWNREATDIFSVMACGDEAPNKKPAPDVFELALKRLGLGAQSCIGLEDSYNGMLASLGAGLPTVVVPNRFAGEGDFLKAHLLRPSYEYICLNDLAALCA